jgi:phi13 family phage major tail protein
MDKNKVKFGLRNVHYAKLTVGEDGTPTYAAPTPWPGAVSLGLDAEGDTTPFYADDTQYFVAVSNNGYSGDFESAMIPDDFNESIMGNIKDPNGVQLEDSSVQPEAFALLFEFEGDKNAIRHVLYNCKMTRASVESATTEDSTEPQTETGTITASPLTLPEPITMTVGTETKTVTSIVKGKTTADTTSTVYQGWYGTVYLPTSSQSGG